MKYCIIVLMLFLIISCKEESTGLCPYLEFNKEAKTWFTQITAGQNIRFSNKKGQEKNYKVVDVTLEKKILESSNDWLFGKTQEYYYYDRKFILFQKVEVEGKETPQTNSFGISITMRPPSKIRKEKVGLFTSGKADVQGSFLGYNSWGLDFTIFKDKSKIEKFETNQRMYKEVVKFKSNSDKPTFREIIMPGINFKLSNTINEVWVDKQYGFIYFKDISGEEWTRVN
jgi:hypothetical protein